MKLRFANKLFLLFILLSTGFSQLYGQFYNGHQMTFGKNRVQYNDFYWQYYRYERFDTYFNQDGRELAEYTTEVAEREITRLESFFDYSLEQRVIFLIYNKLSDFRQSNIGLVTGKDEYNVGGVTQVNKNKVFLFFEGDYEKFDEQISAAIAEVIINEMLYGSAIRENVTNSTLISLPEWYISGLISYVSVGWNIRIEDRVKDGILSERYEKFNRLLDEDAKYAGHSFWRYIGLAYGESVIPNILYLTRVNKNTNYGFLYVLGLSIKELSYDWLGYYINAYEEMEQQTGFPEDGKVLDKTKKDRRYQQIKISPTGTYIAYVTNEDGRYKIWLYNTQTGKKKRIFKRGHKLQQITDYSYPILAWHPSGRILSFITEEEGGIDLYYYTVYNEELTKRNFLYFDKVLSYSFSDDGSMLVLSAIQKGQTDIFVHTLASATNERITNDRADDFTPRFINNSEKIIFSSNRLGDTIFLENATDITAPTHELYIYDFANRSNVLMSLDNHKFINKYEPFEVEPLRFIHLNDFNGVFNRYVSKFDSVISFIDTTTHYRYNTTTYPITNYSRIIHDQDYNANAGLIGEILFKDNRYHLFARDLDTEDIPVPESEIIITEYKKEQKKKLAEEDSIQRNQPELVSIESIENNRIVLETRDTVELDPFNIDINNYVFEREKINYYNERLKDQDLNLNVTLDSTIQDENKKARIYLPAFYPNQLVNQVDFSFLNESYQPFTGGAVYFNPGFNMLFKLGAQDLFEDYKITGGYRFSGDFDANEFLFSAENLKERIDKQVIFHHLIYCLSLMEWVFMEIDKDPNY
ncbi:MAG: TolB family protein [Bacteroidota bacterium]